MKQWCCPGIGCNRFVQGIKYQRIIVAISDLIGNNPAIIQIQNSAEIDFMYFQSLVPFEFRYVCQPLFVRLVRMEIPIQKILGDMLRILCLSRTTVVRILDCGLDTQLAANAKYAFIVDR